MNLNEWFIPMTDMIGIVAFSFCGAMMAIERRLDLFGVLFLGILSSLGGGVIRDLLLGETPPRFFVSYRWVLASVLCALSVFVAAKYWSGWRRWKVHRRIEQIANIFDAVGLAAFSVSGVQLAIAGGHGANAFLCVFMGMTTGVGGGILRDMMTREIPYVLKKHVYAVASIAGSLLFWILWRIGMPSEGGVLLSMAVVILIRILATVFRWSLPRISVPAEEDSLQRTRHMSQEEPSSPEEHTECEGR